jgi:RNA polymerase sigma factor (sigma-70 family)
MAGAAAARHLTDRHLLRRFAEERDEDAFAELMRRHGPLVLNLCRRVLGHEQDAEDAFQAVFLVLARKAASIRKGESVGSFLFGVAYRIAMKERGKLAQRRQREQQVEQPMLAGPVYEAAFRELQILLDEGLNRLPEKYRTPFVLCCLEGKSKSEAARELGWKEGTVSSRLAQARKQLQQFLSRKGVTLASALTVAGIAENAASACIPPLLAASAVRTARLFASGSSAVMETAKAVQLAEALFKSMAALPWKTATALLMVVSLAVGGAGMAYHAETAQQAPASEPPKATSIAARKVARQEKKVRTDRYGDPLPEGALSRLGTIRFRHGLYTRQVVFSPDGKSVVCAGGRRGVCLWDVATGRERRHFGEDTGVFTVAFSPDGKTAAAGLGRAARRGSTTLALWDVATGEKRFAFAIREGVGNLVFSPDGRVLASSPWSGPTYLWDTETGHIIRPLRSIAHVEALAFSPDGKWLAGASDAVGHEYNDQKVHVWEVNTGLEVRCFQGHFGSVLSIAFAPDGRSLASGGDDATVLLWDVTGRMKDGRLRAVKWTPRELEKRWIDLASSAGPQAVQAIWDLTAASEQAVPLLRQRIKPTVVDAKRVECLIRDLDSEDFERRNKATEELGKIVDGAEPALRKKLTEKPSLEVRQRIKQILDKLDPSADADRLRALRALQVLEYAGTAGAREHLRALSKGVPDARLTREAKAALERLAK